MSRKSEPVLVRDLTNWKIKVTRIWPDATFVEDTDLQLVTAVDDETDSDCGVFNLAASIGRVSR